MKNKIKKIIALSLLTISSSLMGVSCGNTDVEGENIIEVVDMINRKVKVDLNNVDRVACIGAGALRLYSYIGDMDNLCGVEDIEKQDVAFNGVIRPYREVYKDKLINLPSVGKGGPSNQYAESEAILSTNPNIIISEYEDVEAMNELEEKLGVPVITVDYGDQQAVDPKLNESLELLGKIFNKEDRANELVNYIESLKTDLNNRTKDIKEEDKPSIYLGCLGNWGVQDIYSSCANYSLFNIANIKNAIDDGVKTGYQILEKEAFQTLDADKIILDACGLSKFIGTYKEDSTLFDDLKAFKNDEVYLQMPYNAYYTNIEVAYMDAYFAAKVAYPEVMADVDMKEKSDEITKMFLGVEMYDTIASWHNGGFQKIDIKELANNA